MDQQQPQQLEKARPGRIFLALLTVLFLSILWALSPTLMSKLSGAKPSGPAQVVEDPIYPDKSGKRMNEPDREILFGYELAGKNGITRHAECKSMGKVWHTVGCNRYVTEQKHFPPHVRQEHFDSGKTTEQCLAEVNAYYEALTRDLRELGDNRAADSRTRRDWGPEIRECQNYDNLRIAKVIYEPTYRLEAILKKVEEGGSITAEDRAAVLNDFGLVSTFPDHQAKRTYLSKREYFFQIADGKIKPPAPPPPLQLSCEEYQTRLDALVKAERKTVEEQAGLDRKDAIDNAHWNSLNKSRIDRLWFWKLYTDGAQAANCSITTALKFGDVVEER